MQSLLKKLEEDSGADIRQEKPSVPMLVEDFG
jgi:hypothetical protein